MSGSLHRAVLLMLGLAFGLLSLADAYFRSPVFKPYMYKKFALKHHMKQYQQHVENAIVGAQQQSQFPLIIETNITCSPNAVIPHPTNCSMFIKCDATNDTLNIVLNCTYPTLFNVRSLDCDMPQNVMCGKYNLLPRNQPASSCYINESTTTTASPVTLTDNSTQPGYLYCPYGCLFPHPTDCNKFVQCGVTTDQNKVYTCPSSMLFNFAIKACDTAINVMCKRYNYEFISPANNSQGAGFPNCPLNILKASEISTTTSSQNCSNSQTQGASSSNPTTSTTSSTTTETTTTTTSTSTSTTTTTTTTALAINDTTQLVITSAPLNASTTVYFINITDLANLTDVNCNLTNSENLFNFTVDNYDLSGSLVSGVKSVLVDFKQDLTELKKNIQDIILSYLLKLKLIKGDKSSAQPSS